MEINMVIKKALHYLILLLPVLTFSQSITVNTTTYTVPQLVTDVLINSSCLDISNVNWRTGTNFGSTNGIGYFQNTNPNFPMQSGVILSTGNVLNAPGPNTSLLNDGSVDWPGDLDLDATLAQSGISMVSSNASVLEFDFVPLSTHFDFNFLFASEEYGNFQCQFSDAFAFLLTNLNTGVTKNLAVVPGTNTPISVVTIRDFLYNSSCPSVNPSYFGNFNGGANATNAAINFNGQTKVLNASTVLTPNVPYRIKLVIADRSDPQSDSAIFISSNSFNIGQNVLGNNMTVANGNSICFGGSHTITSGLNPANFTFQWKIDDVIIANQNGPDLLVSQSGNYSLTYTNIAFPCQIITNTILIEFNNAIITPNPVNIYKCNTGQSTYNFNLAINTPIVSVGLTPGSEVSYHISLSNANNNISPLSNDFTSAVNQTIYIRIKKSGSDCFIVKSFQLLIVPPPVAEQPQDYLECALPNSQTKALFNLSTLTTIVLNGQPISNYSVSYHNTLNGAQNDINYAPFPFFTTSNRTIYIRIQNRTDPSCFSVTIVNLVVAPLPLITYLDDVIVCENYTLPVIEYGQYYTGPNATGNQKFAGDIISETQRIYIHSIGQQSPVCFNGSSFMITIIETDILDISAGSYCNNYILPELPFGSYYSSPGGNGPELAPGSVINSSQIVYFYFISPEPPFCTIEIGFQINIIQAPAVPIRPDVFDCTTYSLPALSVGNYYDAPGGTGNQLAVGTAITTSQTIYIYRNSNACISESSFKVIIGLNSPSSMIECVSFTLPELPIGGYFTGPQGTGSQIPAGTVINTSQTIYVYAISQSTPNCTNNLNFEVSITLPVINSLGEIWVCDSYVLPELSTGNYFTGSIGTGTMLQSGDVINYNTTLYIYLNNGEGCENEESFTVNLKPKPIIDSRGDLDNCHLYVLTDLKVGNYFTGPNGTGNILQGGTVITTSQLIYIYAELDGCSDESSFQVNIYSVEAFQSENISVCDNYVLPALPSENFYYTAPNGNYGTGTILTAGTIITNTQDIYIFKEYQIRPSFICFDEKMFSVTIFNTPVINPIASISVCNSYVLPALSVGNYFTEANGNGTLLYAGEELTTSQTIYVYAETATVPNCFDEKSFNLNIFNVDDLNDVVICENYVLPTLSNGRYYHGPNGTGGIINAGTVLTQSQTVYIFENSGYIPNCSDETSFEVTIIPVPLAKFVPLAQRTFCDEDGVNDGVLNLTLSVFNTTVLGTQSGVEFTVTYYATLADANMETNSITTSSELFFYVRVNNVLAPNCYALRKITVFINKLPEPIPQDGVVCINDVTKELINAYTIQSGLSASTHTFEWYLDTTLIQNETGSNLQVITPGFYSVVATFNATGCPSEPTIVEVIGSSPAAIEFTVSTAFENNQTIIVQTKGSGIYEYQLDFGDFQESNSFSNVSSGIHTITVRDKNGCGIVSKEVLIVNYPKFFTPNGDGYNDTWNISPLESQPNSKIFIYDRYGKLLKEILPSKDGWDGTFNGSPMPSTDYWFTVTYEEEGATKEYKAHFSLKR